MKLSLKTKLLAALALTPVMAATAQISYAQDAENEADDTGPIQDYVVTARKTQETLSDAPVAVSVISSEAIASQGLNSIDDFAKQATGISFSQAFGRSTDRPVIRGASNVLAGVQAGVETGAALFVDGVYYQGDIQGFDPLSIERVEIIKGPQSALYGRNTYAGAINYITKDPTEDVSISGRLRLAEYGEKEVAGSVSGSLKEGAIGYRVGGRFFEYNGQYRNQLTGKKVGDERTTSAYATFVFKPFDGFKVRTRFSWQHDKDGPLALFLQGAANNNCSPGFRSPRFRAASPFVPLTPALLSSTNNNQYYCGVIQPQPNNIQLNTDPLPINATLGTRDGTAFDGIENKQFLFSSIVDWDIGNSGWVVSSLTGMRRNINYFGTDSDHSNAFAYFGGTALSTLNTEPAFANTNTDYQRDFSQEVRFSSPADKPVRLVVGGYYFKQKFATVDILFSTSKDGNFLGTPNSGRSTIEDKSVFGLVEWDITKSLSVTGEIRHSNEKKTLIEAAGFSATAPFIFAAGVPQERLDQFGCTNALINRTGVGVLPGCRVLPTAKFKGTDPRITVNYTTPGGTLIYGVFATGRKPGGFNGTAGITASLQTGQDFTTYLPEKSKGGEIGFKFDALDRRLRGSVAAFYNKLTDVQLTQAIPNPNGSGALNSIVANSGDAKTEGLEVELQAAPADNLIVSLGLAYVNAQFTKGCDADYFILNSGGLRTNFDTRNPTAAGLALCDISGKKLPLGSPYIVNGSVSWDKNLSESMKIFTSANFSFEDSKFVQTDNFAKTGDAFLLNARLGVKTEKFTVSLFGRNLTNEDSIPLATRWFDLRYGAGTTGLPAAASVTFDGRPAQVETGTPRGFFGSLRKGRTFGVEATFNF
jgi:iron complex outermembrane recepter protein